MTEFKSAKGMFGKSSGIVIKLLISSRQLRLCCLRVDHLQQVLDVNLPRWCGMLRQSLCCYSHWKVAVLHKKWDRGQSGYTEERACVKEELHWDTQLEPFTLACCFKRKLEKKWEDKWRFWLALLKLRGHSKLEEITDLHSRSPPGV